MTGASAILSGKTAEVQEDIIRAAQRSFERLPLFEVIMDRSVQALGPALRAAMSAQVDVVLDSTDYLSCGEALAAAPDPGLVALATASPWDGMLAVTVDPDLLFAALEVMLGAAGPGESSSDSSEPDESGWQPRAFTSIEKRLGGTLVALVLREIAGAFAPLGRVTFVPGSIESGPRNVLLAPESAGCIRVQIRVTLNRRAGLLSLIVPHHTLASLRPVLAQPRTAGVLGEDQGWTSQLTQSLTDTPVKLTAVLHEHEVTLADVLRWQPGQVLDLNLDAAEDVTVTCSGKRMFRAAIGRRKNGVAALRLTTELDATQEERAWPF